MSSKAHTFSVTYVTKTRYTVLVRVDGGKSEKAARELVQSNLGRIARSEVFSLDNVQPIEDDLQYEDDPGDFDADVALNGGITVLKYSINETPHRAY